MMCPVPLSLGAGLAPTLSHLLRLLCRRLARRRRRTATAARVRLRPREQRRHWLRRLRLQPRRLQLGRRVGGGRRLTAESLDELLIDHAGLAARKTAVLVADRDERPALHSAQAAHEAPRAVLPLVAVDEKGVVGRVDDRAECRTHDVVGHLFEGLLVARHAELEQLHALLVEEAQVGVWVLLGAEVEDAAQPELLQERQVLLGREAGALDAAPDHRKVFWRQDLLALRRALGSVVSCGWHPEPDVAAGFLPRARLGLDLSQELGNV